MALIVDFFCSQCQKDKQVLIPSGGVYPRICEECLAANKSKEREEALESLKKLSMEERISRLEEQFYDLREAILDIKIPKIL